MLTWTTEKPTQPGWWLRSGDTPDSQGEAQIVAVRERFGGELHVDYAGSDVSEEVQYVGGEWVGPLEPPRDAATLEPPEGS